MNKHLLHVKKSAWVVELFNAPGRIIRVRNINYFFSTLSCGRIIRAVELLEQIRYLELSGSGKTVWNKRDSKLTWERPK